MEDNYYQILLIDFTFYFWHVQKVVLNVVVKKYKNEYIRERWLKGWHVWIVTEGQMKVCI